MLPSLLSENTCNKYIVKHSDIHVGEYETVVPNSECNLDGLMVLATVATEVKLKKQ